MSHAGRTALLLLAMLGLVGRAHAQVHDGQLGSDCSADTDCVAGLVCLPPDAPGWGVAAGICTLPCATNEDCQSFADGAFCVGICLEGCESNASSGVASASTKCHGRDDFACQFYCADPDCLTTASACGPMCGTDEHCGVGLFCNLATGTCQAAPPEGEPPGAACDFGSAESTCLGVCDLDGDLLKGDYQGTCVEPCVLGAPLVCGLSQSRQHAQACIGQFGYRGFSSGGPGDLGACVTLCDCTSDCADFEVCEPWNLGASYDASGLCVRGPRRPGAPDCLNGQNDGAAGAESGCTYGPVRACKPGDCLGTAECLADGTYGPCQCIADASGDAGAGATPQPVPGPDRNDAGCSFRAAPLRGRSDWFVFLMLPLAGVVRVVSRWRGRVRNRK